ncbi:hypothetical protein D5S17_26455 [Pseudonocardiaceae bacterium YIM PH 21723]|nr:hypothetical protein D5S17_26455 [Pseudonocardiaceae bacterium YIM PH 21723]
MLARDDRLRSVLYRALPVLVFLTILQIGEDILRNLVLRILPDVYGYIDLAGTDVVIVDDGFYTVYLLVNLILAALGTWYTVRLRHRWASLFWTWFALPLSAVYLWWPLATLALNWDKWADALADIIDSAITLATIFLLIWSGAAAMAWWTIKRIFSRLEDFATLSTRALPILLGVVTFLFLTAEAWQVASSLSWARLTLLGCFFLGAMLLYYGTRLPEELRELRSDLTPANIRAACRATPLGDWAGRNSEVTWSRHPLTRAEKANLLLVMVIMQLVQVVLLGVLVYLFFVAFGSIAIQGDVIKAWINKDPSHKVWTFFGSNMNIGPELRKVAFLIAGFAAFTFGIQLINDQQYRANFVAPIHDELEKILLVRESYLRLRLGEAVGGGDDGGDDAPAVVVAGPRDQDQLTAGQGAVE